MEMINRLMSDSLDASKFIRALEEDSHELKQRPLHTTGENRQQRRARERAERRAKSTSGGVSR